MKTFGATENSRRNGGVPSALFTTPDKWISVDFTAAGGRGGGGGARGGGGGAGGAPAGGAAAPGAPRVVPRKLPQPPRLPRHPPRLRRLLLRQVRPLTRARSSTAS